MWTLFKARDEIASDGESYRQVRLWISLFAVPLYALALALPGLGLVQTTLITSAIVTAMTGAFAIPRRAPPGVLAWGKPRGDATVWFGNSGMDLRKHLERKPLGSLLCLPRSISCSAFARSGVRATRSLPAWRWGCPGDARNKRRTGPVLRVVWVVSGSETAVRLLKFPAAQLAAIRRNLRALTCFALMLGLAGLSIAWYNWVRNGSPLATGYRADETFVIPSCLECTDCSLARARVYLSLCHSLRRCPGRPQYLRGGRGMS